jgi:hypothetical protein
MRRQTIGLGILLGVASVAVVGAAAVVVPSALVGGAGHHDEVAGLAAPAPREASVATRTGPSTAIARGAKGAFRPGYRRVSRKRVQPRKSANGILRRFAGLIQFTTSSFKTSGFDYKVTLGRLPVGKPLQLRFHAAERVKAAAELRKLSVEDRLARAEEQLGLTPGQMELLERAAAEREAAGDGAEATFERRVTEALNDDQRRRWAEEGYGDSFGGPLRMIWATSQVSADSLVVDAKPVTGATWSEVQLTAVGDVTLTHSDPGIQDGEER